MTSSASVYLQSCSRLEFKRSGKGNHPGNVKIFKPNSKGELKYKKTVKINLKDMGPVDIGGSMKKFENFDCKDCGKTDTRPVRTNGSGHAKIRCSTCQGRFAGHRSKLLNRKVRARERANNA